MSSLPNFSGIFTHLERLLDEGNSANPSTRHLTHLSPHRGNYSIFSWLEARTLGLVASFNKSNRYLLTHFIEQSVNSPLAPSRRDSSVIHPRCY